MAERLATVPERGAPIVPRRLLRLAAGRFQLSNRLTLNQRVPGSSPGAPTKFTKIFRGGARLLSNHRGFVSTPCPQKSSSCLARQPH